MITIIKPVRTKATKKEKTNLSLPENPVSGKISVVAPKTSPAGVGVGVEMVEVTGVGVGVEGG